MARLVFGMNQSLDGYVDHTAFGPGPALFRHFIREAEGQAGSIYGRVMYEVMRYWDGEQAEWGEDERAFAAAWRKQPKWVVSRTLTSVGPNATLIGGDVVAGRKGDLQDGPERGPEGGVRRGRERGPERGLEGGVDRGLEDAIRKVKAEHEGDIEVAGPALAHSLTALGLIDEYRIYLHPVVLGQGTPYFAGPRPPLRLVSHDRIEDVVRLVYVPA